ncbi:hypothetical protein ACEPAF_2236 [Sanghuangporus sanghuang]
MSRPVSFLKASSERLLKSQRRFVHSTECERRAGNQGVGKAFVPRRYSAAATATASSSKRQERQEVEYLDDEDVDSSFAEHGQEDSRTTTILYPKPKPKADPGPLVAHLEHLFPPLEFPDTVATQMLTHISAKEAWAGHNARLAFVGRRVLHSYLLLFLQNASQKLAKTASPPVDPDATFDFDLIAYRALHTHHLGEHVGSKWALARTMLWTPPVKTKVREPLKSPGLYKVQGTTVEGIMGGIFHQFGGTIAQRVFHTRLLPHMLLPGTSLGLHDAFHRAALDMQARMGGPDGLLVSSESSQRSPTGFRTQSSTLPEASQQRWTSPRISTETTQSSRKRIPL